MGPGCGRQEDGCNQNRVGEGTRDGRGGWMKPRAIKKRRQNPMRERRSATLPLPVLPAGLGLAGLGAGSGEAPLGFLACGESSGLGTRATGGVLWVGAAGTDVGFWACRGWACPALALAVVSTTHRRRRCPCPQRNPLPVASCHPCTGPRTWGRGQTSMTGGTVKVGGTMAEGGVWTGQLGAPFPV